MVYGHLGLWMSRCVNTHALRRCSSTAPAQVRPPTSLATSAQRGSVLNMSGVVKTALHVMVILTKNPE